MKRNKPKSSNSKGSLISAIVTGVIVASLLSILLTALLANFVLNERVGEKSVNAVVFVIRTISLFVGTLSGGKMLGQHYLKLVGIIAAGYLFMLIGTGIVFYDGSFRNFLAGIASVLLGGASSLIILQRPKANKHRRRKISL